MNPPPPPAAAATTAVPLSSVRVNKPLAAVNRLLMATHASLAVAAIAYRARAALLTVPRSVSLQHAAMVAADLTLLFIWALSQAGMWRPVTRTAFPERLRDDALPGIDVVVVTSDPEKEPAVEVVDTVVSAMALDYPGGRLSVYLSDDAGSPRTLVAARKAYAFARDWWVPFCRKNNVQCPCPSLYDFLGDDDDGDVPLPPHGHGDALLALAAEKRKVKEMYRSLTEELSAGAADGDTTSWATSSNSAADHDAHVEQIIGDGAKEEEEEEDDATTRVPMLVYVSREKRRTTPHHFKAGALNALLRVSGVLSNAPYVLVLDCDMKCNSRSSAREAMCFHLDPQLHRLAFVQFPQMFHNLSPISDIYCNELRGIFATRWKGLDGLRGPILSGTGFYARRDALCGAPHDEQPQKEAEEVAGCAYEDGTDWGRQVGFLYHSVVEDYFTGYRQLFCRGWTSAYCSSSAAFLGSVPGNLNDVLVQRKRWMSGMLAVGLSWRHCPLLRSLRVNVLQSMGFAYYALVSLSAFPVLCYALLAPLAFLRAAPLFPSSAASSFAAAAFASSVLQHLVEVSVAKPSPRLALRTWWNEQRFWMLDAVTAQLFACVTVLLNLPIHFDLTSKNQDSHRLYRDGVFDFTGCSALLLPATTLAVLNAAALLAGTYRNATTFLLFSSRVDLLPQLLLMCYVAALSYPLLDGMFLRRDAARVPPRITALSVALAAAMLAIFA